mgnify:CR=1 FL=1
MTTTHPLDPVSAKISARNVSIYYGEKRAIDDVSIDIPTDYVTAFIGPSGCGKSTFLRSLNRMNDTIVGARVEGEITLDGEDIYKSGMDVVQLRARVGMVFQKPNPFPKSIYENIAYGPRIHGLSGSKADLDNIVEKSLKRAGLWDEVKDRLHQSAVKLSGGHAQFRPIAGTRPRAADDFEDRRREQELLADAKENGVICYWFLSHPNSFRIAPPLTITDEEIIIACEVILKAIEKS